jgi:ankyrin repeat protein
MHTTSRRSPMSSQENTTVLLAHELARAGKTEGLFVLIGNAGAGLVVRTGADGQSLLSSAAERGQVAVVKGLLRRYRQWIDLDAQDDRGWTALHHAVAISPSAALQVDRTKKKAKETKKTKAKTKAAGGKSRDGVEPMAARQVTARNALRTYFEIHGQNMDEEDDRIGVEAEGVKLRLAHILLEAGASPNVASRSEGVTPFHVAATEALALRLLEAEDLDRSARSKYVNAFARVHDDLSAEP